MTPLKSFMSRVRGVVVEKQDFFHTLHSPTTFNFWCHFVALLRYGRKPKLTAEELEDLARKAKNAAGLYVV